MAQLLVRDLNENIISRLKARAKQHHRSLQGEVVSILENASKLTMQEAKAISEKWHKKLAGKKFSDSAELLREDRNR